MSFRPENLFGAIIDSVTDDAALAELPERIASLTNAVSVQLQIHSKTGASTEAQCGIPQDLIDAYNAHFWKADTWAAAYRSASLNSVVSSDRYISESDFLRSEIYADLLRGNGDQVRCLGMVSALDGGDRFLFGAHRARGQPEFEDDVERGFEVLGPVLTHLIQARRRAAQNGPWLAACLLDEEVDAITVVSDDCQVQYANAAAKTMFEGRCLFQLDQGFMTSPNAELANALSRAVSRACSGKGGVVLGPTLSPPGVRISVDSVGGTHPRFVCVRVRDQKRRLKQKLDAIRAAYGFTPSETALAEGLARGVTLADYAAYRGVSMTTVKTQLRRLFEKTQVSRQADLVALIWAGRARQLD